MQLVKTISLQNYVTLRNIEDAPALIGVREPWNLAIAGFNDVTNLNDGVDARASGVDSLVGQY